MLENRGDAVSKETPVCKGEWYLSHKGTDKANKLPCPLQRKSEEGVTRLGAEAGVLGVAGT